MKSHTLAAISFLLVNASCSLAEDDRASPGLRGQNRALANDDHPVAPLHETRIIGGSEARPHRHNFAVSLQDGIGAFCGGSLIARDVVLGAAHCEGGSYVVLGRHDMDDDRGQKIRMKREVPHPKFKDKGNDNDFLLVFLKRAATLGRDVGTVALNSDSSVPRVGEEVTAMGWGDTAISDSLTVMSDVLQEVQVNVVSNGECESSSGRVDGRRRDYNGKITQNILCAMGPGRDSCQGDSGGPLVAGDVQVGVVSWGISCASDVFPGVYARVSRAYDWITEEVCRGSDYAAEAGFDCSGGRAPAPAPRPSSPSSDDRPSSRPECADLTKRACKDKGSCLWKKGKCASRNGGNSVNKPDRDSNDSSGSCAQLEQRECKDHSKCHWKKGWKMCLDKPHRKRAHNLFG